MNHSHLFRAFGAPLFLALVLAALQEQPAAAQLPKNPIRPEVAPTAEPVVSFQPFSLQLLEDSVVSPMTVGRPASLRVAFPPELAQAEPVEADLEFLRVGLRVGAGYTTSGGSFPALGRFEAFVPLWQEPGERLGFLEGRLAVNADENLGGSLLLGYRGYNADANRVRGGYLAVDGRGTRFNDYFEVGTGYESLGETWDFRFNAYLPLGNSQRVINDINVDTGVQTSTRFQGNLLLLETQRQEQRLLQTETALGGFDAEAGYRLAHWDEGDLRGFGGVYLLGAPGFPSYLGWRLRLASNITPNFNAGVALQEDGLFGTRLVFSIGATFPGIRPQGPIAEADTVRARLGEPTVRLPEIAIAYQEDSFFTSEQTSQPLMNPEEDQPYWFQHVTLGTGGGDGTFENPFGAVQSALNATRQDGNDVVYINGDSDIAIPAFTIPERVQVLSQGPRQFLAALPFPSFAPATARLPFSPTANYTDGIVVELPFSGDGNFPRIENGVTLGNRTVLAGFRVENAGGNAITGSNIRNVELRNNTLTNPAERGIFLNDVGGSVVLFDNTVTGAAGTGPDSGQGILIRNTTTLNSNEVTIAGYRADNNRVGIELTAAGNLFPAEVPNQVITLGPSSPVNTSIGTSGGVAVNNSASGNREQGILIQANTLGSQEVAIEGAAISSNGAAGLEIVSGTPGGSLTAFQEVQIRESAIANNTGAGIRIEANETAEQEFNIDGNQIVNNGGAGIDSVSRNSSIQEFVAKPEIDSQGIGSNIITGNGGPGIVVSSTNADVLLLEASQNTFGNNASGSPDLQVSSNNSARTCAIVFNNTGATVLEFNNNSSLVYQISNLSSLSFDNGGAAVTLNPSAATFTDISSRTCL
ncbi:MAG: right-handed parallel beta-helix repeat-containing protein [Cyanobacteria bacterium Co-bin8]|nr:right-handed parallel beta-helix repeat-containing protein [Cyanobacteria bacterium Co-bin8]